MVMGSDPSALVSPSGLASLSLMLLLIGWIGAVAVCDGVDQVAMSWSHCSEERIVVSDVAVEQFARAV